ncbi:MAG: ABC transporter substrate-binding protein [Peptococcaceae bacterium]
MPKYPKVICSALIIITFLLSGFFGSGCSKKETTISPREESFQFPLTVQDDLGRKVKVTIKPERIVSLSPSNTEILFALGLDKQIAGVTKYCDYPSEALKKPKVGGFADPSLELIVNAKPDLVLAGSIHRELIQRLEELNIPVVVLEPKSIEQVLEKITLAGKVTGTSTEAQNLVKNLQKQLDEVEAKVKNLPEDKKPRVFFELYQDPLTTIGGKSYIHDLLTAAGGKNITGGLKQEWLTYSTEQILAQDPEVIIFVRMYGSKQMAEQVKRRPNWQNISAVKNDRVYYLANENIVLRPGPRLGEGLKTLAGMIHPDIFK